MSVEKCEHCGLKLDGKYTRCPNCNAPALSADSFAYSTIEEYTTSTKMTGITSIPFSPRRLVSLWDMIEFLVKEFIEKLDAIGFYTTEKGLFENDDRPLQSKIRHCDKLTQKIVALEQFAAQMRLIETKGRCERLAGRLLIFASHLRSLDHPLPMPIGHISAEDLVSELEGIRVATIKELGNTKFAYIPHETSKYFEQDKLFDKTIYRKFPSTRKDIREAGNCLAADLGTAAIFHLMRVVELGLRAVARDLAIPIPPDDLEYKQWQTIIDQLRPAIRTKTVCASMPEKEKAEIREFYNGLIGEFECFKDVWRNNIMHSRRPYSVPEAIIVFDRVSEFMKRLSQKLSE